MARHQAILRRLAQGLLNTTSAGANVAGKDEGSSDGGVMSHGCLGLPE